MESMLGSRRRGKKEISILYWYFRNNYLSPSSSRTFMTQSYWSFISGQCGDSLRILLFFHIGCAFILHSIINNGLILGGQYSSRRQTVFFLLVDLRDKSHKDPDEIDLNVPTSCTILAQCMEETSRRGILGRHQSCDSERINILSDSIECNHLSRTIRDGSGQLGITQDVIVVQDERKTSRSQEISVNSFNEEICSSDRSGQPGITQDVISVQACSSEDSKSLNVEQTHDRSGQLGKDTVAVQDDVEVFHEAETLNIDDETIRERIEADMDFKIPGLPHSIVKHAQSASVRELIQKIENHPHRHALQRDLRQNQSFNPFSPESKQMIHEVGNIELCELLDMEPKTQCKICLTYWDIGIVYCTYGDSCVKEEKKIRNSSSTRWTSFPFPTTS